MKPFLSRTIMVLAAALLVGGCATYNAEVDPGRSLAKVQRVFVISNLNDNHGLDHQIVESLKARGRTADSGPLTMMPDDTQAVVTFQDRWTWDFSDHLVYLQISVRDVRSEQPYAAVTFSAKVPLHEEVAVTVARLVDNLLKK